MRPRTSVSKPATPEGLAALLARVEADVAALGLDPVDGRREVAARLAEHGTGSLECLRAVLAVRRDARGSTS